MRPHAPAYQRPTTCSRRRFLEVVAAAGIAGAVPHDLIGNPPPLVLLPGTKLSRVVTTRNPKIVNGPAVHETLAREMLASVLMSLTGADSEASAWSRILKPDDVIALKFNQSGQNIIRTTHTIGLTLIRSLVDSGWKKRQLMCVEAPPSLLEQSRVRAAPTGFSPQAIDFGSGSDQLARVVDEVSAIINVPFLKTHNIARMTGALKNLSHGLIKHPARYHANGCAPYIGDIVANTPIRKKLRLHLVDATRIVFRDGPQARAETMSNEGLLIGSLDPVAADFVGLTAINDARALHKLGPIATTGEEVPFLRQAHLAGLGVAVWHGIDLAQV